MMLGLCVAAAESGSLKFLVSLGSEFGAQNLLFMFQIIMYI
jgi:hypothetical protein